MRCSVCCVRRTITSEIAHAGCRPASNGLSTVPKVAWTFCMGLRSHKSFQRLQHLGYCLRANKFHMGGKEHYENDRTPSLRVKFIFRFDVYAKTFSIRTPYSRSIYPQIKYPPLSFKLQPRLSPEQVIRSYYRSIMVPTPKRKDSTNAFQSKKSSKCTQPAHSPIRQGDSQHHSHNNASPHHPAKSHP